MGARTVESGYGWVAKSLHWLVVLAMAAQFVIGYSMDADHEERDCDPIGERRSGGDTSDAEEDRLDRLEDACEEREDARGDRLGLADPAVRAHVVLGLVILGLAVLRLVRRRFDGLPAWSEHLSERQRTQAHWTEKALLVLLFVVPISGLALLVTDDVVALHVAAHLAFFAALASHMFLNLRPRILARML